MRAKKQSRNPENSSKSSKTETPRLSVYIKGATKLERNHKEFIRDSTRTGPLSIQRNMLGGIKSV